MGEFRLGKYQLLVELARGGMGIVYLAVTQGPGGFSKLLILKELKPDLVDDPTFLSMFLEEARLAARLDHPNIVQTLEIGQDGRRHFIAMEYLQGQPLSTIRRHRPPGFTVAAELRVIREVLRGLQCAHTVKDFDGTPAHVIHRDVSPQNVFVTYDGEAKIVDFGIAKAADTVVETQAGMFKGKVAYIAPEQVRGEALDPRTDVFAAGIMVWEAFTGQRMWNEKSDIEILRRLLKGDIPRLATVRPDAPAKLARIVDKAMASSVVDRYASAEAMGEDIEAYLAESGGAPSPQTIGAELSKAFRAEREQLRSLLEPQLAALRRQSEPTSLPSLSAMKVAGGPATLHADDGGEGAVTALISTDLGSDKPLVEAQAAVRGSRSNRVWIAVALAVGPLVFAALTWSGRQAPAAGLATQSAPAVAETRQVVPGDVPPPSAPRAGTGERACTPEAAKTHGVACAPPATAKPHAPAATGVERAADSGDVGWQPEGRVDTPGPPGGWGEDPDRANTTE